MPVDFALYLISARHQCSTGHTLLSTLEAALRGGVRAVQLREKDLSSAELFDYARQIRTLTRRYGAHLFINDRVDIALAADADGVHLTEQSVDVTTARELLGHTKLIGVSTHSLTRALSAARNGADLITFSPVFYTPSKAAYGSPQGVERLREVCAAVNIPVFALGGINPHNQAEVHQAGASGIALISAIFAAPDPAAAAREFNLLLPGTTP
ncbi:MAG: thiamine phosphate synthase [Desulfuromonadaceae bacterium]|nr:thiamine phosphate synthase [Desulfuromonadaceae bacterium]